jgi:hypothetical protein
MFWPALLSPWLSRLRRKCAQQLCEVLCLAVAHDDALHLAVAEGIEVGGREMDMIQAPSDLLVHHSHGHQLQQAPGLASFPFMKHGVRRHQENRDGLK